MEDISAASLMAFTIRFITAIAISMLMSNHIEKKGLTTRWAFIEILKDSKPRNQAKIIRGVFEMAPPPEDLANDIARKKLAVYKKLTGVVSRLEAGGHVHVPDIADTSEVVIEALKDAEALLQTRGPKSAVDRAHTALHGYLKKICSDRGATVPTDPSLTALFKVFREQFNELSGTIPHDLEAKRLFGLIASSLESLNTIRNRGTLAHPNSLLLDAPEAMLYINLARSVLAYIETKIKK
jgi:hypothetical protein